MTPSVYLETTIVGYLVMEPSGVLRIAANQQTTHEWWTRLSAHLAGNFFSFPAAVAWRG
jgi:hypothetical protein